MTTSYRIVNRMVFARGKGGFFLALTPAIKMELEKALAEAGEGAIYKFNCGEAVIMVPELEMEELP